MSIFRNPFKRPAAANTDALAAMAASPQLRLIKRALAKADFRGLKVEAASLGEPNASWRSQFNRDQAQARWDARRHERQERRAWGAAIKLLPAELVEEMMEPGETGIFLALVRNTDLRLQLLTKPEWGEQQRTNIEVCKPTVREALDPAHGAVDWSCDGANEMWIRAAAMSILNDIACTAQGAIEQFLDGGAPQAVASAKTVRL